ncbi:MAG: glycosyltransferase [Steroidobacteraceae bacterium]
MPSISVICPVHNEAASIGAKTENLLALEYPRERLQFLVIGDGCTDESLEIVGRVGAGRVATIALPARQGKAAALNAGLERATGEIVVFTDAGIQVAPGALRALAGRFADPIVGCVSGEDRIEDDGSESLYGRMELQLRRDESRLHSIAGASGCLYGIRRTLCRPFRHGMAPDFLSVLDTVRAGCRAVAEPAAYGTMAATGRQYDEFGRKTRTILRGMTALSANLALLNPFRHTAFSFILFSHKLSRWLAPIALAGCLVTAILLWNGPVYRTAAYLQILFYSAGAAGLASPGLAKRSAIVRLCAFFILVNGAAAKALVSWLAGVRQEIWQPTRRAA